MPRRRTPRRCVGHAAIGTAAVLAVVHIVSRHSLSSSLGAVVPATGPGRCTQPLRRQWLLGASGAAVASAAPGAERAHASSIGTPFGFELDVSFLDPPAPPDVAKPPPDAEVTPSGLASKVLLRPSCALSKFTPPEVLAKCQRPAAWDRVVIDYTGWQTNGKMFDSSRLEKKTVRVNSIMPGWTEGLPMMSPGETRRFWVPASLGYGDNPDQNKPTGPLVFDIELYSIERQPKPPDDLAAMPADATTTPSGLGYKVLRAGSGSRSPSLDANVTVQYNGWESGGDLFMSSSFGAPTTFKVGDIPIKGLAEGVQMMVEGEKRMFWIPPELAFGKRPANGLPSTMLVYDIELSAIT
mmetsp:Transcript_79797/g.222134  ORF Transcript_79797/g.222134 Transcript_79797/m.222134 type:complete len:353 (-) Transcript_79797:101-1159(-)